MVDITIQLLSNKSTRQQIDGYDVNVIANRHGYQVVAGENDETTILVSYPPEYRQGLQCVYMRNALGEYMSIVLTASDEQKQRGIGTPAGSKRLASTMEVGDDAYSFALPAEMTFAGNTFLTFFNLLGETKTVWQSVVVPILATGVDYKKVAEASPEILDEAIKAIAKINALSPVDSVNADKFGIASVYIAESGRLTFENIKGNGIKSIQTALDQSSKITQVLITYDNGRTMQFALPSGDRGIGVATLEKYATEGLLDKYVLRLDNGQSAGNFEIMNGASVAIIDGIYSVDNPLPDFADTHENEAYILDVKLKEGIKASIGRYDLYIHGKGGAKWTIVEDWGGVPGKDGEKGDTGAKGDAGAKGETGKDGENADMTAVQSWVNAQNYVRYETFQNTLSGYMQTSQAQSQFATKAQVDYMYADYNKKLIAGDGINIADDGKTISASGGGGISYTTYRLSVGSITTYFRFATIPSQSLELLTTVGFLAQYIVGIIGPQTPIACLGKYSGNGTQQKLAYFNINANTIHFELVDDNIGVTYAQNESITLIPYTTAL